MEERETYIEKVSALLTELSAKIDELKVQATLGKAEARDEYLREIEALKGKKAETERRLNEMKSTGEKAWEDLTTGMDAAVDELKKAAHSAAERLRGK